ncbi:Atxe2 family lasso peptide isopeptidase [Luteimonas sp. S4-F44]|uniref:Atxe2 family lasso peptide isopeptidase n=1 Tax=Luteimonas sp. S4-F44 TaxID=2925842 RepID=UPI001F5381A1|nr:Atxe2 family lasso peptide isopeptidase [Luteimonas sp. S4-F44]UNK42133.1 Atxe2 family lasso peptide isopeptidase [Luteimonas sp. S4-F44]
MVMVCLRNGRAAVMLAVVLAMVLAPFEAAAVSPRRLVEVVDLSGLVVSPNGRQVAFRADQPSVERNTYDSVWYVQDVDGRAPPRRVAEGGVPLRNSSGGALPAVAHWSADGRSIFYRALLDGRIEVWRAAVDGSGAEPVARDPANVRDFRLGEDATTLQYSVGAPRADIVDAEQAEYARGIHVDASIPIGQGVFRSGHHEGRLATQRFTGLGFDREGLLDDVPERWFEIDLRTGARRELAPPAAKAAASPVAGAVPLDRTWVRDPQSGRTATLTRALAPGGPYTEPVATLAVLDRRGREIAQCTAPACTGADITSGQWRPGRNELLFTTSPVEAGRAQTVFRWSVDTGAVTVVASSRGLLNGGREVASACGVAADAMVCVATEADRPPRLERIEIDTGQRQVLFDPNASLAFDLAQGVSSRFLRWRDAEGREFTGQLLLGRGMAASPRPLFVTYYTCSGFLRGGTGDEWPLASFAQAGIAALCITALPHKPDPITRYDEGMSAVRSVVDLLAGEGVVDPGRVGMGGFSFGSEVTLWMAAESDLLAAASVTSPAVTPLYHLMGSLQGERFATGLQAAWGLGAPDATPEAWRRLSLAFNRQKVRAPVLFQMPEQEYLYALDYIIPMVRDGQADLYLFPTAPHMKFEPQHKLAAYERNLDWFCFWLQGVERDGAGKAPEYARWHRMKQQAEGRPSSEGDRGRD